MSKITVAYESGAVWVCEVEAFGGGDAGEIVAAAGLIELIGGELVYSPNVMTWQTGEWRAPTGVVDEWTSSIPGYVDALGKRTEKSGRSVYSERETVETAYPHKRYVLLKPAQLEGAISVTVDNVLAFVNEGQGLMPAVSNNSSSEEGMEDEFATSNRPAAYEQPTQAAYALQGVGRELEVI